MEQVDESQKTNTQEKVDSQVSTDEKEAKSTGEKTENTQHDSKKKKKHTKYEDEVLQTNVEDLVNKIRDENEGVKIQDRTWYFKTYKKCFVGSELVSWLVVYKHAKNRKDAIIVGNYLMDLGYFKHVTNDHAFKDENLFYRFNEDEAIQQNPNVSWTQFLSGDEEKEKPSENQAEYATFGDEGLKTALEELDVKPLDQFNLELLDNVHPPYWKEVDVIDSYNMVVIGAGSAGLVTAAASAGLGAKTVLIEKNLMGGDCLNFGCVPSKALLRAAKAAYEVKNSSRYGIEIQGEVKVDFAKIMERMRKLRAEISENDSAKRFADKLGVHVFFGEAKFISSDTVSVNGKNIKFSKCCIATGARPALPPVIAGLKDIKFLTNENLFNLTELPRRFCIIGGGPIGCEIGQAFSRFGSQVTIIDLIDHLMGREDQDAAEVIQEQFEKEGIQLYLKSRIQSIEKNSSNEIVIQIEFNGKKISIEADQLLVSVGRRPNVLGLNLEAAGIKYDERTGIHVNDRLQTSNSNVFACGDVCTQFKFTHMADSLARIVVRNALFFGNSKASALTIPWCTYTDPEVAHVGLYERDFKVRGIPFVTFVKHFSEVDRAILEGEDEGFVKIHVQEGTDQILGATIVGKNAGNMISEVTLAMVASVGLQTISTVIHPYPTHAEAIRKIGDDFNRTRLTPTVKILFRKLLQMRK